jgi:hypothetical protein
MDHRNLILQTLNLSHAVAYLNLANAKTLQQSNSLHPITIPQYNLRDGKSPLKVLQVHSRCGR